ncbi:hypothetical protein K2F54_12370 [Cryobacterium sp. 1639]|uniref:kelch repeat-containing protein n=1 Tax=Cryobacterium inferilacus TaxID=2866629 RepID=UPI001C72C003|nr:kelch repeat-containing protein [Cryobacterium sp. 1639]MBX0300768.1 hypothetical protein [Cryobacterium sp. 1639]
MKRISRTISIVGLLALLLSGCSAPPAAAPSPTDAEFPIFTDGVLTYERVEQPGGGYFSFTALFVGTLTFENGCLLVGGDPYLFPADLTSWDGTTLTVDGLEYQVGDKMAAGGGQLHDVVLPDEVRELCGENSPVLVGSVQEEIPDPIGPPDFPTDEAWGELPESPLSARRDSVGAWVRDRVVIVGGWSDQPCPATADCAVGESAQRTGASYDPVSGEWAPIAEAPMPVSGNNIAVFQDNLYVLTSDVFAGSSTPTFLQYNITTDAWSTLPSPPDAGTLVAAGDRVFAIPGSDENGAVVDSVFFPDSGVWAPLPDDPLGPSYDRTGVWLHGTLKLSAKSLASTGADGPAVVRIATLDSNLSSWFSQPDSDIIGTGAVAAGDRVVFPFYGTQNGGEVNTWDRPYANGGIFNPADNTWKDLPELPAGTELDEYAHGRPPQVIGHEVLIGGRLLLDPMALTFTELPEPTWAPRIEATVITGLDSILVWGGVSYEDGVGVNHADGYLLGL